MQTRQKAESDAEELVGSYLTAIRGIRSASDSAEVLNALVTGVASFAQGATLLLHRGDQVISFSSHGDDQRPDRQVVALELDSAPAIAQAVESRKPAVATAVENSISKKLCEWLSIKPGQPVHVFPFVLRDTVLAVLLVDGILEHVKLIEALVLTAEAWVEALNSRSSKGRAW